MTVCVPLAPDGRVGPQWGRTRRVAVARVEGGTLAGWQEFEVAWDELPEIGTGGHRTRVAHFLREHGVQIVLARHMSNDMRNLLSRMGVTVRLDAAGDARVAAVSANWSVEPERGLT